MKIFGIEGTAWNASASLFDSDEGIETLVSNPYQPQSGGIHPREASEHIASSIDDVIDDALEDKEDIDAIAFSMGPGLGPCLRVTGTAARALSLQLDLPLIGVNHTIAHIEMGRYLSGFEDPVVLDAAGANTLVTTYNKGKYHVLGETFDTGAGNALDKFARHVGLSHPGGPKIEKLAEDVDEDGYIDLPYTVKGMDLAFSGLVNAAQQKFDNGIVELEKIAFSLQENIFSMLTEVSERALSLTGKDTLVVGGGVSSNSRLREMLEIMCNQRGAKFYSPSLEYLTDNAAMIAVTGWFMAQENQFIEVEKSKVKPGWRPESVPIMWRKDKALKDGEIKEKTNSGIIGAEANIKFVKDTVIKNRKPKKYRCRPLDQKLRKKRTSREVKLLSKARKSGVPTPIVLDIDKKEYSITLERLEGEELKDKKIEKRDVEDIARILSNLHSSGIAHGDPTTRNFINTDERIYLIDFGLAYKTWDIEDFGMDIHIFEEVIQERPEVDYDVMECFWNGYSKENSRIKNKLKEIKDRGRYI